MKIGALVPARIGSKRLPKKNIKVLGNKPLICWTIDVLLEADFFCDITVSTESDEIADVVRGYYSEKEVKILKRPHELAQDDSPMREVIYHYLENRPELDWYGVFMPTFPFRKVEKLIMAWNKILTRYLWKVESVTEEMYCLLDFFYPVKTGVKRFFKAPIRFCRYSIPVYNLESVEYPKELWWDVFGLCNYERSYQITLSFEETIDIDTIEDWKIAENFLKIPEKYSSLKLEEFQLDDKWILIAPQNFDYKKVLKKFKDKLKDNTTPLLVLKEKILPVSFLQLQDGVPRNYIASIEARKKIINEKVKKTQNMKYFEKQYRASSLFRFLRIAEQYKNVGNDTDLFGQIYKSGEISNNYIIPWDRIIMEKELLNIWLEN